MIILFLTLMMSFFSYSAFGVENGASDPMSEASHITEARRVVLKEILKSCEVELSSFTLHRKYVVAKSLEETLYYIESYFGVSSDKYKDLDSLNERVKKLSKNIKTNLPYKDFFLQNINNIRNKNGPEELFLNFLLSFSY